MDAAIVVVVVAVLVVAAFAVAAPYTVVPYLRGRRLRHRFGAEYDRVLAAHGERRAAERELVQRERRHGELRLREIPPDRRSEYAEEWSRLQEGFVDAPHRAVEQAGALVDRVIAARGYDDTDPERRLEDLSVDFPEAATRYREAREQAARAADGDNATEQQRSALVGYRTILRRLLPMDAPGDDRPSPADPSGGEAAESWPQSLGKRWRLLQRSRTG